MPSLFLFFSVSRSNSWYHTAFSCCAFLFSDSFSVFYLFFCFPWPWHLWERLIRNFLDYPRTLLDSSFYNLYLHQELLNNFLRCRIADFPGLASESAECRHKSKMNAIENWKCMTWGYIAWKPSEAYACQEKNVKHRTSISKEKWSQCL